MELYPPVMHRSHLAALAALALVLACLAVLLSGPSVHAAEDDSSTEVEQEIDRQPVVEEDGDGTSSGDRSEVETIAPVDPGGTPAGTGEIPERYLRGTVLDENYEPVAEAWVMTDRETEPLKTQEDGSFEIPLLEDFGPQDGRNICAWKEGLSIGRKWVRQLEGNLIILKPDEGKEIRIVDQESGLPIEGAEVELLIDAQSDRSGGFFDLRNFASLPHEVLISDADGKVRIPDPEVSEDYTAEVRKEGYVKRYVDHWTLRRRDQVSLSQPEELRMRFVRQDGSPHAGAQICFPWYRKVVTLDEDGWGDLPPEARWGFWSVQLRDATTQWVWTEVDEGRIQPGAELATNWRPRKGRLFVQGDEKPTVFEVGTTAAWEGWGWQEYMPSPVWNHEAVDWVQVDEDGHFELPSGRQGEISFLHVRRVGSEGVMLSQKLVGDGPYELTLSAAAQVELEVRCPRPELLEGASLNLYGHETDHQQDVSLAAGRASVRLPADRYSARLTLANSSVQLPLDDLVVIGLDMEHVFHFEGIRTITGRLTAGGKPLFPCRVDLRTSRGFSTRVETRPDGSWSLDDAPKDELRLYVRPEDKWLTPVEGAYLWMPAGTTHFDHDYQTATLLLSLGSFPANRLEGLRGSRRYRDQTPRYSPLNGERQRLSSTSVELPDLGGGPTEITLLPGRVTFSAERSGVPLADLEVVLAAGDVRTFQVDTLPTTLTRVVVSGFSQPVWGNVSWEPIDVPGLQEYPGFAIQEAQGARRAGQIDDTEHLLEGRWRMRIRAPFWAQELRAQVGHGQIDTEVLIRGSQQTIRLELDETDRIRLANASD